MPKSLRVILVINLPNRQARSPPDPYLYSHGKKCARLPDIEHSWLMRMLGNFSSIKQSYILSPSSPKNILAPLF